MPSRKASSGDRSRGPARDAAVAASRHAGRLRRPRGFRNLLLLGSARGRVRLLERTVQLAASAAAALVVIAAADRDDRRTLGMAAAGEPWAVLRAGASPDDEPDRADGGPHPVLSFALAPGGAALVLAHCARPRVIGVGAP